MLSKIQWKSVHSEFQLYDTFKPLLCLPLKLIYVKIH